MICWIFCRKKRKCLFFNVILWFKIVKNYLIFFVHTVCLKAIYSIVFCGISIYRAVRCLTWQYESFWTIPILGILWKALETVKNICNMFKHSAYKQPVFWERILMKIKDQIETNRENLCLARKTELTKSLIFARESERVTIQILQVRPTSVL